MNTHLEYYLGGYFLIKPFYKKDKKISEIMPERFISISGCFCPRYPDPGWYKNYKLPKKELKKFHNEIKQELSIDNQTLREIQNWIESKFEKDIGWPDIFYNLPTAKEFYHRFLTNISDLELIGIALPETYLEDFINQNKDPEGKLLDLMAVQLSKKNKIDNSGLKIGFEILGHQTDSSFHDYFCNKLEDDYHQRLGIQFNKYGFIDKYEDADKATRLTNEEELGEPVYWHPWLLYQYEK